MGNVNGSNVVRNGDWEHQICWTDPRQQQQPKRSNSESSSVQTWSDEQNSCYGSDEAYLTAGDSCIRRSGGRESIRKSFRQAKSVIKAGFIFPGLRTRRRPQPRLVALGRRLPTRGRPRKGASTEPRLSWTMWRRTTTTMKTKWNCLWWKWVQGRPFGPCPRRIKAPDSWLRSTSDTSPY